MRNLIFAIAALAGVLLAASVAHTF